MIRRAGPHDSAAMETFLQKHAATSMFLRGNLDAYGTCNTDHPHGTAFYVQDDAGGIFAIAGRTNCGYMMCQAPGNDPDFLQQLADELYGKDVAGVTAAPTQVDAVLKALGGENWKFAKRDIEPLYEMDLSTLDVARFLGAALRAPVLDDITWLAEWFRGYHADTGVPMPIGSDTSALAATFVSKPDSRLLIVDGAAVAMTALNARVTDMVQVGGVYVPPAHRGCGYGGQAVALHMDTLRQHGITSAILFAANSFAARAYEAIGFQHIGFYEIALLKEPYQIGTRT